MSSWRNLMTPLYEKHYLKDSSNSSSMSQSNFAKISTLQMKESIGYSDKLKDLQSQMSRLKGELTKYSTRDKNPKKSGRAKNEFSSPEKASESYFGITAQIQEESSLLHDADKLDILEEDTILASPELTKKRRSKGRIVRNSLRNANVYDSPYAKPNRSELLSMNRTRETETSLYDDNQAKTYMGPVTEVMKDMEYENKLTTQKLRKRGSHRERHETEPEESGTLKNALAECCLEINNLKQVVLDSQDQIKYLCEELSKEKKKSNELREELQQCSVVLSNRKHNTTFAGTPLRKEINTGTKQFSQDVKRQILWSNRQRDQIQAERNSHVTCKGFDDYGRIEADVEEFKLGAIRPRREESSSKDFSRSRHEYKEIAVQCDFMLDGIMDSHEEEIEEQKEEINKLKAELNTVKNHKNDLIESFQQIVGLLTAPDTTKAKALQDTQNIFSDYYNAINAKMGEFQQAPTRNFNSSKKSSKFNGMTSNYMGKSRHNRTEISDNLMYSPSNTAISFDNELMESRLNTLVNSLKFGSQLNNY